MASFVPLNSHMMSLLENSNVADEEPDDGIIFGISSSDNEEGVDSPKGANGEERRPVQEAILALRSEAELPVIDQRLSPLSFLETPFFLDHGTEDPEVEYKYGKLNAELLRKVGIAVDFRVYERLEHCYLPADAGRHGVFPEKPPRASQS